ncbi:MAG: hypothetical protein RL071_2936 [Pseudomonadota bacterium]
MTRLRVALPEGPLDIIGDIHGEIDALRVLLTRLGVDVARRRAPRHLVFVGDLVDRGPDSVAVVQLVADLVDAGQATVVMGNHELNLLQGERKEGNGWLWDGLGPDGGPDHFPFRPGRDRSQPAVPRPFDSRQASAAEREAVLAFFRTLPLVAERPDLRVVHAAPDPAALAALPEAGDVVQIAAEHDQLTRARLDAAGVLAQAAAERAAWGMLRDPNRAPTTLLEAVATQAEAEQAGNPINVLTSGLERRVPFSRMFWAGGKWRFVTRDPWWERYGAEDPAAPAVVVGHYWRRRGTGPVPDKADVWWADPRLGWSGPTRRAYCVDFSVGRRFVERAEGARSFAGGLGALRWPEATLVFDDQDGVVDTRAGQAPAVV